MCLLSWLARVCIHLIFNTLSKFNKENIQKYFKMCIFKKIKNLTNTLMLVKHKLCMIIDDWDFVLDHLKDVSILRRFFFNF